jgi:hypothetical protein
VRRNLVTLLAVGLFVGVMAGPALARGEGNPHPQPVIYVTSQGLAYDSIVLTELPFVENAPYQKLEMDGPTGLQTEWGPGDRDFVGGRWWVDANDNGYMDEGDAFFMCPLLGPGFVPSS